MANRDSKSGITTKKATKTERYYTVGYLPNQGRGNPAPSLRINGYWLQQFGFTIGQPVTVTTEPGKLIIELEGFYLDS